MYAGGFGYKRRKLVSKDRGRLSTRDARSVASLKSVTRSYNFNRLGLNKDYAENGLAKSVIMG